MESQVGIKRFDHVCWAVWKIEDVLPFLTQLLGCKEVDRFRNEEAGYAGVVLAVPGSDTCIEVLEPIADDSFLARFLRKRGPGIHHLTFEVKDVEKAAEAVRSFGIEPWGGVRRNHGWVETFVHPKDSGGVLIQFYQEEDHTHEGQDGQGSAP
jgi:methylmalonyl-CoA/ethylmalonyl-CoA epimerase